MKEIDVIGNNTIGKEDLLYMKSVYTLKDIEENSLVDIDSIKKVFKNIFEVEPSIKKSQNFLKINLNLDTTITSWTITNIIKLILNKIKYNVECNIKFSREVITIKKINDEIIIFT